MRRIDDDLIESRSGGRSAPSSTSFFYWIVFLLLLAGFAAACWLGSFFVFGHPEKPFSYKFLTKVHKLDPPKRFELTMAPRGEFLSAAKILERYSAMSRGELAMANEALLRNYLMNYKQTSDQVPYVIGVYDILDSYELTDKDIFSSGVVALAQSTENPQLLLEQVFPAEKQTVLILQRSLLTGLPIRLQKSLDLSAIVNVQKLPDGRMKVTALPLAYGTYMAGQGTGSFSLLPPKTLNIDAGLPVLNADRVAEADQKYISYRRKSGLDNPAKKDAAAPESPRIGMQLMRVEPAVPVNDSNIPVKRATRVDHASPTPTVDATVAATPLPTPQVVPTPETTVAQASPTAAAMTGQEAASATPTPAIANANAKVWPVYPASKMPRGRLLNTSDVTELVDKATSNERIYLQGNFMVTASGNNRAVLRPQSSFIGRNANTRIIVDFPQGSALPSVGSQFGRNAARPFLIMDVRKGADGNINVYAHEITQP
ncbi:MAG: hypothetical protein ABIP32_01065 [Chthoniobacterales bacterium]